MTTEAFDKIRFSGTFRDYQQCVLDNFERHAEDQKIHIVASPGSGKTVLGLEMIRRLGKPALILSPSITIRQQWGDRFQELFCEDMEALKSLLSYDIRSPKCLTSITYQALHSAVSRNIDMEKIEEEDPDEEAERIDFKDFNLLEAIRESGIRTICLDEAHHLKTEWQAAISTLIDTSQVDFYIISLTATPPYDSKTIEWKRYEALCGEIDDEIFVPQLVAQKTLCPHQDYIFFNYPTPDEAAQWMDYRAKAYQTVCEIITSDLFKSLIDEPLFSDFLRHEEFLFEHIKPIASLLACLSEAKVEIPTRLIKHLLPSGEIPPFTIEFAEISFQFLLGNEDIFGTELVFLIRHRLAAEGLIARKNVALQSTDKLRKMIHSSMGKLNSIVSIVKQEHQQLGEGLRMLILTDFIKSELKHLIGSTEEIGLMGTVTIFETLRRSVVPDLSLALLSGSLVIVHQATIEHIEKLADLNGLKIGKRNIAGTSYSELTFNTSNKYKVSLLTELFQKGHIQVIVGTKSLLGEGWDAPCINSLILASFVGSFVLSNQMRGRAIRVNKENPGKTANIWHLVTVDPEDKKSIQKDSYFEINPNRIHSEDYEQCRRKFENFMAPAYHSAVITSGIERCDIITPPFEKNDFDRINKEMLRLSGNREQMRLNWENAIETGHRLSVMNMDQVPSQELTKQDRDFLYINAFILSLISGCIGAGYQLLQFMARIQVDSVIIIGIVIGLMVLVIAGVTNITNIMKACSPKKKLRKMLDGLLVTLRDMGEISSLGAQVEVLSSNDNICLQCGLINATHKEKGLFSDAVKEMLSVIESPKYVFIRQGKWGKYTKLFHTDSYACPSIIGIRKEFVEKWVNEMNKKGLFFQATYTRNQPGRISLLECRKQSIRNRNETIITGKKIVKREYE